MITNYIVSFFYLLGEWGFVILFLYGLFFLRFQINYLSFFVIGLLFNSILNMFLKAWWKQPRPSSTTDLKNLLAKYGLPFCYKYGFTSDEFAMPSGHSQNVAFILSYLYFTNSSRVSVYAYLLGLLVIFHRFLFGFHTVNQIMVGILFGLVVSYCFYYISKRKIIGFLKNKKDDNYFGLL